MYLKMLDILVKPQCASQEDRHSIFLTYGKGIQIAKNSRNMVQYS